MHETHVFLKPLDQGHRPISVMVVGPAWRKRIGEYCSSGYCSAWTALWIGLVGLLAFPGLDQVVNFLQLSVSLSGYKCLAASSVVIKQANRPLAELVRCSQ